LVAAITRLALILAVALVAAGCGEERTAHSDSTGLEPVQPQGWTSYAPRDRGFTVSFPARWRRPSEGLSPTLVDPVEILSLTTSAIHGADQSCGPVGLQTLGADDAFLTVLERGHYPNAESGRPHFPPRPAHFSFEPGHGSEFVECLRTRDRTGMTDHWFEFADAGRLFHVLVVFGESAPESVRGEAYEILDTLRFDPEVKPDWEGSP
jgi:hypothetical protein